MTQWTGGAAVLAAALWCALVFEQEIAVGYRRATRRAKSNGPLLEVTAELLVHSSLYGTVAIAFFSQQIGFPAPKGWWSAAAAVVWLVSVCTVAYYLRCLHEDLHAPDQPA